MKLLVFLAVLTFVRGTELEQSDDILRELESLVDGKVAKENDDSELKELIKTLEDENKPEPLSDEAFEEQMLKIAQNDPAGPRGRRPRPKPSRKRGDANCKDKYGKCYRKWILEKCKNKKYESFLKKKCSFTCGFCTTERCEDSRFGCCRPGSNLQADGPGRKGCLRKMCKDIREETCKKLAEQGRCEGATRKQMRERCPRSCGVCSPKQAVCEHDKGQGFGCCDSDGTTIALGPKNGCPDKPIFDESFKVPEPTCDDKGFGCCRTDGSIAATGPKKGCPSCKNMKSEGFCERMSGENRKLCHTGGSHTIFSLKILCRKWCGYCQRT